ncbi:MAG: hypothetical protein IKR15_02200 [Bacteroidales bacterium]|nr:hypothetical protein [Bacteroidales bacterium]
MDDGRLHVVIDGEYSELRKVFAQISEGFKKTQQDAEATGKAIDRSFSGLSSTLDGIQRKLRGFLTIGGLTAFVSKVKQTREYFQDIESAMEIFLGSAEKASKFTEKLKDYAWYNTFEFDELAAASKQLLAFGNDVNNVIPIIDKLSNVATATRQPLMDLVQLYNKAKNVGKLDARSIQQWASRGLVLTDVLKEMGQTVDRTNISFQQLDAALNHVTQEGGMFAGIMEKMMPNLSMSWGQLQDDLTLMFNEIGEALQGPMQQAIEAIDRIVDNYKTYVKWIGALVAVYGTYRAALAVTSVVEKANLATKGLTIAAEKAEYMWLLMVEKAQKKLNATIMKNPYVLAATALATFISAVVLLQKQTKTASELVEESQDIIKQYDDSGKVLSSLIARHEKLSASVEKTKGEMEELQQAGAKTADQEKKLTDLTAKYNDENSRLAETAQKIIDIVPNAVDGIDTVTGRIKASTEAARQYNEETKLTLRNAAALQLEQNSKKLTELQQKKAQLQETINNTTRTRYVDAWTDVKTGVYHPGYEQTIAISEKERTRAVNEYNQLIQDIDNLVETNVELERRVTGFYDDLNRFNTQVAGRSKTELELIKAELAKAIKEQKKGVIKFGDLFTFDFQSTELIETALKSLGGTETSDTDLTDKQRQAAYRRRETQQKQELTLERKRIDQQNEIRAASIKAMADGTAKSLAESQLDHDKEMEQIRRNREDTLKQLQDNQKAVWLAANPDRKEYDFKTTIKTLPKEYADMFDEQERLANEAFAHAQTDLLNKYGTLEERRRLLMEDWQKSIDALKKAAEGTGDTRAVSIAEAERDLAVATLEYEDIKDYGEHDAVREALAKQIAARVATIEEGKRDIERAKGDLELAEFDFEHYDKYGTKDERRAALKAKLDAELALVDESAKDIKAAMNAVELAEFDFGNFDQFQNLDSLTKAINNVYEAKINLAKAQGDENEVARLGAELHQQLYQAMQKYSAVYALIFSQAETLSKSQLAKAIEETQKAIKEAKDSGDIEAYTALIAQLQNQLKVQMGDGWGFGKVVSGFKGLGQARDELDVALKSDSATAESDAALASGKIAGALAAIGDGLDEVSSAFKELGSAMQGFGGTIGEIGKALSGLASNTENIKASFTASGSGDAGSVIAAGISSTVALISMVGNQIAENKEIQEEWNLTIEKCAHKYRMLKLEALDYKQQNIFGVENPYKKAIDGATQYQAAMETLRETAGQLAGGQVQTGTKKAVDWENVGKGVAAGAGIGAAIGTAVGGWAAGIGTVIGTAIGAVVGGLTGLFAGMKEVPVFENLLQHYGQIYDENFELNEKILADYDKLDDATKQLVDNWEEIADKAREAEQQMRDNFAELSGDIGNQLADSLVAAFRNGDLYDAIDDFHGKMTSTIEDIMEQLVFSSTMGAMFDELEDRMMKSFGVGGDEDIVDDLIWMEQEYQKRLEQYNEAMSDVQSSLRGLGYDAWQSDQRTAQTKAALGASQDSVDESNARLTTIQGHTFEINENVRAMREQHHQMIAQTAALLEHVQGIHSDTADMRETLAEVRTLAGHIKSNVGTIIDRGVKAL